MKQLLLFLIVIIFLSCRKTISMEARGRVLNSSHLAVSAKLTIIADDATSSKNLTTILCETTTDSDGNFHLKSISNSAGGSPYKLIISASQMRLDTMVNIPDGIKTDLGDIFIK